MTRGSSRDRLLATSQVCDASYEPRDFILLPYVPPASPTGKLAPASLLLESLSCCAPSEEFRERFESLLIDLRDILGVNTIVWGFKMTPAGPAWELYFYRADRPAIVEVGRVFNAVDAHLPTPFAKAPGVAPTDEYGLFSFDVLPDTRRVDEYNLYTVEMSLGPREPLIDPTALARDGDPPYLRQVLRSGAVLRAHSFRMRPGKQPLHANYYAAYLLIQDEALMTAIRRSPFATGRAVAEDLNLQRFATGAFTAHALKQEAGGLYYCRVGIHTAIDFVTHFAFPAKFISFLERHASELDHLLLDVGSDYVLDAGKIVFTKAAIFGTF